MAMQLFSLRDVRQIVLYPVFPNASVVAITPAVFGLEMAVNLIGSRDEVDFFYPLLRGLVKDSPMTEDGSQGTWIGMHRKDGQHLTLWYTHGSSNADRLELLERKFRYGVVTYCDLMVVEEAGIEAYYPGGVVHKIATLPQGLERNGSIIFSKPFVVLQ